MNENEKIEYKKWLKDFGRCLSAHRNKLGLSQRQAAKQVGFHYKFYADIEYGRRPITTRTLFQVCKRFDLPVPYQSTVKFIT